MITPAPPPSARPEGGVGGSSPPPLRRRRPNSSFSRRLKLRQSSSRSGGPWLPPPGPPLGPSGPREPRPQLGSFKDIDGDSVRLQWERLGSRSAAARRALPRELGNRTPQPLQAGAGARASENARNPTILVTLDRRLQRSEVDLVPHQQLGHVAGADLGEHLVDFHGLRLACRRRSVDHVQQQVGVHGLLERGAERRYQPMRQVAHESDGVGQHHVARVGLRLVRTHFGQPYAPRGRIQGGEQLVGGVGVGVRKRIEQRRLAGVGIADDRDRKHIAPDARAALHGALLLQLIQLSLQDLDSCCDVAPIELQLLLARTAGLAQAAALALEVAPAAHQPCRKMLQARELHLQLALAGLRALREDLQDQLGAIEHAALQRLLQVALLPGRELVVEHYGGGVELLGGAQVLCDLARAGIQLGIRPAAPAADQPVPRHPGALHQAHDFFNALRVAGVAEVEAYDDRRPRVGGLGGALQQTYASGSLSAPRLIGRDGTTVEIACLYTICVTELRSSTTYWSNDSIWPCSLMPLTR